ncbi:hypothetical protein ACFLQ6_11030, partial [Thermoproteota archaeon]
SIRLRDFFSNIFGRQYVLFRICSSHIPYIEKSLCAIPDGAFQLLGCKSGDRIICESTVFEDGCNKLERLKLKAYAIPDKTISEREKLEKEYPTRYPSIEKILKIRPDIWRIFIDSEGRKELKVEPMDTIRARRELGGLFLQNILHFGYIYLAFLALLIFFIPSVNVPTATMAIVFGLIMASLLILLDIRSKIK